MFFAAAHVYHMSSSCDWFKQLWFKQSYIFGLIMRLLKVYLKTRINLIWAVFTFFVNCSTCVQQFFWAIKIQAVEHLPIQVRGVFDVWQCKNGLFSTVFQHNHGHGHYYVWKLSEFFFWTRLHSNILPTLELYYKIKSFLLVEHTSEPGVNSAGAM
jgi:hypothetical protein